MEVRGIYPILDAGGVVPASRALNDLDQVLAGGARWVQLRGKTLAAGELLGLAKEAVLRCHRAGARLVVNDRPDIAFLAGADGVHLGQDDLPADVVRRWLPEQMIIGVSCHRPEELTAARALEAASYLAYGPVFATRSKPNPDPVVGLVGLAGAKTAARGVPLVAIGGLTTEHLRDVRRAGASAAAMIGEIFSTGDVRHATARAIAAFEEAG